MAADLARAVDLLNQGELLAAASILEVARGDGLEVPLEVILACGRGFLVYGYPGQAAAWLEWAVREAATGSKTEDLNAALGWLGLAYLEQGLTDKATAVQETTRREDLSGIVSLLLFRARWLAARGDRAAAGALYEEGLTAERLTTAERIAFLIERGRWQYAGGDFAAAGRDWHRADKLAGLLGDRLLLAWCRRIARGEGKPFVLDGGGPEGPEGRPDGREGHSIAEAERRPAAPRLYFQALGEFAVWRDQEILPLDGWPRRKAVALLQYLALQPHWRVPRDKVVELFWGEEAGVNALHVTLHALRQGLTAGLRRGQSNGFTDEPPPVYVTLQNGVIGLEPDLVAGSDVQQFRACVQAARVHWETDRVRALDCYRQAKSLYGGELLTGVPDQIWLTPLRENTRQMYLEALTRLAEAEDGRSETHSGEAAWALGLWLEILELEPAHEEAVRQVMLLLARSGRKNKALSYYHHYTRYMEEQLGLNPAPSLRKVYRELAENRG